MHQNYAKALGHKNYIVVFLKDLLSLGRPGMGAVRIECGGMCRMQGSRGEMSLQLLRVGEVVMLDTVWAEICQLSRGTFPEDNMRKNPEVSEVQIFCTVSV